MDLFYLYISFTVCQPVQTVDYIVAKGLAVLVDIVDIHQNPSLSSYLYTRAFSRIWTTYVEDVLSF